MIRHVQLPALVNGYSIEPGQEAETGTKWTAATSAVSAYNS
jgi:hypothetical protein